MTTRSQTRKVVAELASGEFEASVAEISQPEIVVAGPANLLNFKPIKHL